MVMRTRVEQRGRVESSGGDKQSKQTMDQVQRCIGWGWGRGSEVSRMTLSQQRHRRLRHQLCPEYGIARWRREISKCDKVTKWEVSTEVPTNNGCHLPKRCWTMYTIFRQISSKLVKLFLAPSCRLKIIKEVAELIE